MTDRSHYTCSLSSQGTASFNHKGTSFNEQCLRSLQIMDEFCSFQIFSSRADWNPKPIFLSCFSEPRDESLTPSRHPE